MEPRRIVSPSACLLHSMFHPLHSMFHPLHSLFRPLHSLKCPRNRFIPVFIVLRPHFNKQVLSKILPNTCTTTNSSRNIKSHFNHYRAWYCHDNTKDEGIRFAEKNQVVVFGIWEDRNVHNAK